VLNYPAPIYALDGDIHSLVSGGNNFRPAKPLEHHHLQNSDPATQSGVNWIVVMVPLTDDAECIGHNDDSLDPRKESCIIVYWRCRALVQPRFIEFGSCNTNGTLSGDILALIGWEVGLAT
jgi:hypothetical protein